MKEERRSKDPLSDELAAMRQRIRELEALQRAGLELSSSLDLSAVLDSIVESALALVGASDCLIYLYDGSQESYSFGTASGRWVEKGMVLAPRPGGLTATVVREGRPVVINDAVHHPLYESPEAQGWNIQAIAAFPLRRAGQVLGVLHVVFVERHTFREDELRVLELLADQAATAIENAQLYTLAQQEITMRVRTEEELRHLQEVTEGIVQERTAALEEANAQLQREVAERELAEAALRKHQERLEERVEERTAELRASEERYRTLFDGVPMGLYRSTPAGVVVDANRALMEMLGYPSREEYLTVDPATLYVDPEDRVRWQALMEREGVVRDFETQFRRFNGTVIWVNDTARAVRDERGHLLYYEGSMEDITERKQATEELRRYRDHLEELVAERTAELRESEKRYRTLFDGVPVGLYRTTPQGKILDVNRAFTEMSGYPDQETLLAAETGSFYVEPEEQVRWRALMEREGVVRDFEARLRRTDGTLMWVNDAARAVRDEQGQVLYYEGILEDITERKRAEEELRKHQEHLEELVEERTAELRGSEERYRTLFDGVPVGLYRSTPAGEMVDANLALVEMLGYRSRTDYLEVDSATTYVNPQDRMRWQTLMEREGVVRDFETLLRRPDGMIMWVNDTARAVRDEQGQVLYYEGSLEDITERKRAEDELRTYQEHLEELVEERTTELRASEKRYRTLFDGVPVGLWRSTPDGRHTDDNLAMVQILGYPSREALQATDMGSTYVNPEERVQARALAEREGAGLDIETQMRRYDGSVIWVRQSGRAVKDEQGKVLYYEGTLEDITERKQFEEEIRRQKDYFEALFNHSPVAVVTANLHGNVASWNPMAEKLFGYTPAEAIGKHIDDLVARDDSIRAEAASYTDQLREQGRVQVTSVRNRKDGSLVDVELLALPLVLAGEQVGYYAMYHDISERKRVERELRRQKEYYEALFVNSPAAVVTIGLDGNVVSWNPTAERLFGYTRAEAIGQNIDDLVASDDSIRAEAVGYTDSYRGETYTGVVEAYPDLVDALGRLQVATKRTRKDGSLVDVELLGLPVIVAGEEVGFVAIYHDISPLQQARREAEAANQAKSTFLANMSHELRTPLNAILGFSQLMEADPNLSEEQLENLSIINASGEHLLALINDVLEMSKIEAGRVTLQETSFDLYGLLDTLEEMTRLRAEEKGLHLSFLRADNVPQHVVVDEGKLRQVLSNLLGNAVKFTQEGAVVLRVEAGPVDGEHLVLHFEVEDTGPGIAPNELEAVFEPFVQAAGSHGPLPTQAQEGTGLGLSISRQFARLMGGDITASTKLGQGTLFRFDLQAGVADPTAVVGTRPRRQVLGLAQDQRAADGESFRLLVVEDRENNRRLLVKLLESLGFEVQEATNGQEAIEVWERWRPHLIWMDMRMPVMDGHQATQQIKATPGGQDTIIIALTATAFEEDREEILLEGCDDFVRKPFRKDEIYDALARHLGVQFLYEAESGAQEAAGAAASSAPIAYTPTPGDLADLPAPWLAELQQATTKADLHLILGLLDQIRGQNVGLAEVLTRLAQDYEYRKILTLIEQSGGEV